MNLTEQTPGQLAELRLKMADEYSKAGELKVKLMRLYALYYESFRDSVKSDAALERKWELTKEGLDMMELSMKLKTIEKKMSAIKSLLDVRNNEQFHNSY
jgi:hypothetical protein